MLKGYFLSAWILLACTCNGKISLRSLTSTTVYLLQAENGCQHVVGGCAGGGGGGRGRGHTLTALHALSTCAESMFHVHKSTCTHRMRFHSLHALGEHVNTVVSQLCHACLHILCCVHAALLLFVLCIFRAREGAGPPLPSLERFVSLSAEFTRSMYFL